MPQSIHIVSFDVPYPPSYGGVIDVYYKIKALKELGVDVHLHAFDYGRGEAGQLNGICKSVQYYPRNESRSLFFSKDPYIIASRRSGELLKNISGDDLPVLFEGLHCCAFLDAPELRNKKKFVRTHNIEHDYYRSLAGVERKMWRKMYFLREANKLEKFEKKLALAEKVFAISPADAEQLSSRYKNVEHVMAFHPNTEVKISLFEPHQERSNIRNKFALYHGNLEVGENNQAALFLVNEVFSHLATNLTIAGNNPSAELRKAVAKTSNVHLAANIPTEKIDELIENAHVNILPTFQATGIKLKLLTALFRGKFCLVNSPMIANTGLEELCVVAETSLAMRARLNELFRMEFTEADVEKRKLVLGDKFSNKKNAEKLVSKIF
ncbi:MAG TPA: glycosyltransferase family 1 protein [Bacteroidia bacterium]|nr:glycosyltransferase family 1 protein [Bacteroidia bacterium]